MIEGLTGGRSVDVPAMVAQMHAMTPDASAQRFATFEKMMSNHHFRPVKSAIWRNVQR